LKNLVVKMVKVILPVEVAKRCFSWEILSKPKNAYIYVILKKNPISAHQYVSFLQYQVK